MQAIVEFVPRWTVVESHVAWTVLADPRLLVVKLRGEVPAPELIRAIRFAGGHPSFRRGTPSLTDCRDQAGSIRFEDFPDVIDALHDIHGGEASRAAVVVSNGFAMAAGHEFGAMTQRTTIYMTTDVDAASRWLAIDGAPIVRRLVDGPFTK